MASCKSDLPVEGSVSAAAKEVASGDAEEAVGDGVAPVPAKKARMAKATTMVNTAKEAKNLLGAAAPDPDVATRGQQKKLDDIQAEKPSPKKPAALAKHSTMVVTAKEGNELLAGEKLGDTRQITQAKKEKPSAPKKNRTIQQTMEEAKYFMDTEKIDVNEGRRTRSAGKPKPEVSKSETKAKAVKKAKKGAKKNEEKKEEKEEKLETVKEDTSE